MTPVERLLSEFEMFAAGHVPEIVVSRLPMLFDALRAELRPGDPRVTTHHADCWQTRGHHACAIAKIEAMQKREATLVANLNDLSAQPDGSGIVVYLDYHHVVVPTIDAAIALLPPAPPTDGSGA